jgi:hypothetical protein
VVGTIGYAYISDSRVDSSFNTRNCRGSIFTLYKIIPRLFGHAEYVYFSYERITSYNAASNSYNTDRVRVPFLLGSGLSKMISPNVWEFAEVLFDVLSDPNSSYNSGDPFVSFSAGVGF